MSEKYGMRRACIILPVVAAWFVLACAASSAMARVWVVDGAHPRADDAGEGTAEQPFRSIAPASRAARPGDTVRVAPGVYRERVAPARGGEAGRPIVYEAAQRGTAIVRGSDVFAPRWEREGDGTVFRGRFHPALFTDDNPFHRGISIDGEDRSADVRPTQGELRQVLGEVFVNGKPYEQVTNLDALRKQAESWMTPAEGGAILVHFPADAEPAKCLVEITTRDRIFAPHRRGLAYIHVRGFVFEHCANQGPFPQAGAVSPRSGNNWVIEGNTIRFAATIGLDCGGEYWDGAKIPDAVPADRRLLTGGHHLIRDNDVSDNGLCGIAGWTARDVRIEHNRIERNNRRRFPHPGGGWEEWAGIKLHHTNAVIRGNLVRDNHAFGIWLDNGYADARIEANLLLRNRGAGIFIELGASPDNPCRIVNNIVSGTAIVGDGFYGGFGIYAHDASDLVIAHNLVFNNAGRGLLMRTITDRQAGGKVVETSRSRVVNNLFVHNSGGAMSLPYPNDRSKAIHCDHNVYWANGPAETAFTINKYQGTYKMEDVAEEFRRRLTASGVPAERLPDAGQWVKEPGMTLDGWRLLMGLDRNSVQGEIAVQCEDEAVPAQLRITLDRRVREFVAVPVEGVDQDFRGRVMPKDHVVVGPLQGLNAGENQVTLEPGR